MQNRIFAQLRLEPIIEIVVAALHEPEHSHVGINCTEMPSIDKSFVVDKTVTRLCVCPWLCGFTLNIDKLTGCSFKQMNLILSLSTPYARTHAQTQTLMMAWYFCFLHFPCKNRRKVKCNRNSFYFISDQRRRRRVNTRIRSQCLPVLLNAWREPNYIQIH